MGALQQQQKINLKHTTYLYLFATFYNILCKANNKSNRRIRFKLISGLFKISNKVDESTKVIIIDYYIKFIEP